MRRKQVLIVMLIAASLAASAAWTGWSAAAGPFLSGVPGEGAAERLAFVLPWFLGPAAMLALGVVAAASGRWLHPDAIDGTPPPADGALAITIRYVSNTAEQAFLAVVAWSALAVVAPAEEVALVPSLAVLFVVARAAFWAGYLIAPWARAFGFAATFYPTLAVGLRAAWLLV